MAQQEYSNDQVSYELALKLRDLEENNRLMKERLLLLGKNLIESQQEDRKDIIEIKKSVYNLESDMKRVKEIIESLSEEISKSARREELAILSRQFKMFQPLEYARIEDVEKIIAQKSKNTKEEKSKESFWTHKTYWL